MRQLRKIIRVLGFHIDRFFQKRYTYGAYKPTRIEAQSVGHSSPEHHIQGIFWISHKRAYCQSTTLQMIARHHNIDKPRDYFAFLIGYTFGAVYMDAFGGFFPFTDPEPGLVVAAPPLGLERKYLITDDKELFLKTIRHHLSQDIPVRIGWNAAIPLRKSIAMGDYTPPEEGWIDNVPDFLPHSVLFVGYDEAGFHYYETGGEDKFVEGETGTKVTNQIMFEAVMSVSSTFQLPWVYMLTVFTEALMKEDLNPIWRRNGKELVGFKFGPMATGSFAIKRFADSIQRKGANLTPAEMERLKWVLEPLSYTRIDNALFLERHFAGDREAEDAAKLLRRAGGYYEQILRIIKEEGIHSENVKRIVGLLSDGASLEKETGKRFLNKGR